MNNTVQSPAQPKPMRRPMNTRLIAAVVIVALLAVVGVVVNNVRNQKGNQNWTVYKNQQAGIQLSYPSSWGQPNFRNKPDPGDKTNQEKDFNFSFYKKMAGTSSSFSIDISLVPDNISNIICTPDHKHCGTVKGFGKDQIMQSLTAKSKQNYAKYDTNSYAIVYSDKQTKLTSAMEYYSVVNLPKFHISAVHIGYYIIGSSADCPNNKFSDTANCISDQIYKDVARVAQSIKII
jgi:hypothetical protein